MYSDDEVRRVFDEFRQVSPDRAEEVERLLKEGEGVTVERGAPVDATHVVSGLTDSADKKEQ